MLSCSGKTEAGKHRMPGFSSSVTFPKMCPKNTNCNSSQVTRPSPVCWSGTGPSEVHSTEYRPENPAALSGRHDRPPSVNLRTGEGTGQMPCLSSHATKLFHPMTNRGAKFLSGVFLVPGRLLRQGKRSWACRREVGNLSGGGPEFPRRQP